MSIHEEELLFGYRLLAEFGISFTKRTITLAVRRVPSEFL